MDELTIAFEKFADAVESRLDAMDSRLLEALSALPKDAEPGPAGEPGPPGEPGKDGEPGPPGEPGVGLKAAEVVDGVLVVELTDGTVKEVGPVTGPMGERGEKGEAGEPGRDGEAGPPGEPGVGVEEAGIVDGALVLRLTDGTVKEVGPVVGPMGQKGDPGRDGKDGEPGPAGKPGERGPEGQKGADGRDGRDGIDGKDGKDGIASRDEIRAEIEKGIEDRLPDLVEKWVTDEMAKRPDLRYRGIWKKDAEYEPGNFVTWAGSLWHADAPTKDKPGDGKTDWTLAVKQGLMGSLEPR